MTDLKQLEEICQSLVRWFALHKRELPWRKGLSSYGVWVSEVMLQQTQVAAASPYFNRWMSVFPTIERLAKAPESEVLKIWEGLGYYSRARRLHAGAKWLYNQGRQDLPQTREELLAIPGIGEYTAGAILTFAWKKPSPAIDGNVIRVLSRLFCVEDSVEKVEVKRWFYKKMEQLLSASTSHHLMEATIEFGALVCKKVPSCQSCPLKKQCLAYQRGKAELLPMKKARQKTEKLYRFIPIIVVDGHVHLKKRGPGEVMEGLYEFPYMEFSGDMDDLEVLRKEVVKEHGLKAEKIKTFEMSHHSFTRYKAHLYPTLFSLKAKPESFKEEGFYPIGSQNLFFSSGHKKIWKKLCSYCLNQP